jgi:hypothetical protein
MIDADPYLIKKMPAMAFASAATRVEWSRKAQGVSGLRRASAPLLDEGSSVDIGRFARVVTSGPVRMDGARALRTEEDLAEDVFLETDVPSTSDGNYIVPIAGDGLASIGLVWLERRPINAVELQFAADRMPAVEGVRVQVLVGDHPAHLRGTQVIETLWQGQWVTLPGPIERQDDR